MSRSARLKDKIKICQWQFDAFIIQPLIRSLSALLSLHIDSPLFCCVSCFNFENKYERHSSIEFVVVHVRLEGKKAMRT